jgi:uncharacterized protein (UPF0335 family)
MYVYFHKETCMENQTTVQDLERLCLEVASQREIVAEFERGKKAANELLETLEQKVLDVFKGLDKTSYDSKVGKFIISHRQSVKLPATPEDRERFFQYLKDSGQFDSTITVHSATLNRLYKDEFEKAKDRGDDDFEIPGIGPPTVAEILSVRKS